MADSLGSRLVRALGRAVLDTIQKQTRTRARRSSRSSQSSRSRSSQSRARWDAARTRRENRAPDLSLRYPGDYRGVPTITYDPHPGSLPDPGEVVWGWVPFEEDHSQGKDRPVLLIGRDGDWLLGLPLTSKDHDRDAAQEAGEGRHWIDIGSGGWDAQHRSSEVRVDRIIRVDPTQVRRTAGKLDRTRFDRVAAEVRRYRS